MTDYKISWKWKRSLREKKTRKHHQYDLHRKWLVNFLNVIALIEWYTYNSVDQSLSPGGATDGFDEHQTLNPSGIHRNGRSQVSILPLAVTSLPSLDVLIILLPSLCNWQKIKFPYTLMARTHVRQSQSARLTGNDFVQKVSEMRLSILSKSFI